MNTFKLRIFFYRVDLLHTNFSIKIYSRKDSGTNLLFNTSLITDTSSSSSHDHCATLYLAIKSWWITLNHMFFHAVEQQLF